MQCSANATWRRRRSRYRIEVPAGFGSPQSWSDGLGRWRAWTHGCRWLRVVRFLSALEDRERWYVERRVRTPGGWCWIVVDSFTRPGPAFRRAVKEVRSVE